MSFLQGQTALVTGAGAGIGAAIALAMARAGANLAAADIDAGAARQTAEEASGNAGRAVAIEADCGDVARIEAMVARTVAEFGRLDILVNNAGITRYAALMDLTEQDWDRIHRVNAKGVFFCLQTAARAMIRQNESEKLTGSTPGGRIVNIASISGRGYAGASNAAYAASKGAVIALTKLAALQLGRHNITVNAICPGVTRTALGLRNAEARAAARGVPVAEILAESDVRSRSAAPIPRKTSPRWRCFWSRPARATLRAKLIMSMAVWC